MDGAVTGDSGSIAEHVVKKVLQCGDRNIGRQICEDQISLFATQQRAVVHLLARVTAQNAMLIEKPEVAGADGWVSRKIRNFVFRAGESEDPSAVSFSMELISAAARSGKLDLVADVAEFLQFDR